MSSDFIKVLTKDDRLLVSDKIAYSVNKGGQNCTSSQFNAISESTSSHTYNIQVPSEQTVIDRRVLWKSTCTLKLTVEAPVGQTLLNYGLTDALGPFPLHSLCSVMTASINNNSVSINIRDVLPALLRFNDRRELQRYNGYCPVAYDTIARYSDGLGSNLNALGDFNNPSDNDLVPRGSWVLDTYGVDETKLDNPPVALPLGTGAPQDIYVRFTSTEPLLLSPFIFADPQSNNQGIYGVQNMNFVFNIGSANRVWRTANSYIKAVSVQKFSNSQLIFNFLSPHPSDLMPSRNCVPYYEMPRYITTSQQSLPALNAPAPQTAGATTLSTSSLQINSVPDKLIIMVRKPSQTNKDPDAFACIKGISVNFNNQSGILSSATQQDLYRYSVENGSNQSWLEFSGAANLADVVSGTGRRVATSGSLLVLQFGKDIQLSEDYYASGSLGNFNLQVNLQCYNQGYDNIATPEIVLITMNSGIFCCERGTSSVYTGILTKNDVLEASQQTAYSNSSVKRLVGGGFLDSLKSVVGAVLPHVAKLGKEQLGQMDSPYAKAASGVLGALGYGRAGAGSSGGMKQSKLSDRLMN